MASGDDNMTRKTVLVITKNAATAEKISDILNNSDYLAVCCDDCGYTEELNSTNQFSLILFDAADEITPQVKALSEKLNIPLLALCETDDTLPDSIPCLADPLRGNRLISEINALCSGDGAPNCSENNFKFGNITFCRSTGTATKRGKEIPLSLREQELLSYLCAKSGRIVSKREIMTDVWQNRSDSSTINVHILKLRKKLEDDPENPRYIRTVRGEGFILRTK